MAKVDPPWLRQARELCRDRSIKIAGWGPQTLVVYAESPERAKQIVSALAPLGLQPVQDEDDANAGLLTLSQSPADARHVAQQHRFSELSVRPLYDRLTPVLELGLLLVCFAYAIRHPAVKSWTFLTLVLLLLFLRDAARIWGWDLKILPEALQVRRSFRWSTIPWAEIRSVESSYAGRPQQEAVTLVLSSNASFRLGTFGYRFGRALCDRLREEIAHRHPLK